jgi:hypothetical protein
MFPLPMLTYIKIAAVVAALAFAYYKGYSGEHEKFVKFQAEVAAVGKAQEVINQAKAKEHEVISTAITNQYEARLSAVHSYYGDRLLDTSAGRGSVPAVSKPASCAHATPTNAVSARQCAETTLQLTELQNWVRSIK